MQPVVSPDHAAEAAVHSLRYCGVAEYLFAPPCFHSWQERILQPVVSPDHAAEAAIHSLRLWCCGILVCAAVLPLMVDENIFVRS